MSCLDELAALVDEELLDFLLNDGAPCPEMLQEGSNLLEAWDLAESELLDKGMDDFINNLLSSLKDEPGMQEGYSWADSDGNASGDQLLSQSPGSNFAGSPQSSNVVQVDHNYSLHFNLPAVGSMRSDMGGQVSADLGTWMRLEGTSKALQQSSCFPAAVAAGAQSQLVPGAVMQAKEQLLKRGRRKMHKKQSAKDNRYKKKICLDNLENKVAACAAQNHELEKKVQLLQKQNTSLLQQFRKLQAFVRKSTTKSTAAKTCTVVVALSFCFFLSISICSLSSRQPQVELGVLSRQIGKIPNGSAPGVREDAALKGFGPEPEKLSRVGSLSQSREEG